MSHPAGPARLTPGGRCFGRVRTPPPPASLDMATTTRLPASPRQTVVLAIRPDHRRAVGRRRSSASAPRPRSSRAGAARARAPARRRASALGRSCVARREPLPPRRDLPAPASSAACCGSGSTTSRSTRPSAGSTRAPRRCSSTSAPCSSRCWPAAAGEGFPRTLLAGCAIAFAGAVFIGAATSRRRSTPSFGRAAVPRRGRRLRRRRRRAEAAAGRAARRCQVTSLACAIGAVACLPFGPQLVAERRDAERRHDRLDRSTSASSDRDRVHDVGLRARAHERRDGWAPRPTSCRRWRR